MAQLLFAYGIMAKASLENDKAAALQRGEAQPCTRCGKSCKSHSKRTLTSCGSVGYWDMICFKCDGLFCEKEDCPCDHGQVLASQLRRGVNRKDALARIRSGWTIAQENAEVQKLLKEREAAAAASAETARQAAEEAKALHKGAAGAMGADF